MKPTINPYRYRGYRFDTETGLYYLQSRYYNPSLGRFISMDDTKILMLTQGEVLGANLFAYCNNNPVMYVDPSGYLAIPKKAITAAIEIALLFIPPLKTIFSSLKQLSALYKLDGALVRATLTKFISTIISPLAKIGIRFAESTVITKLLGVVKIFTGLSISGVVFWILDNIVKVKSKKIKYKWFWFYSSMEDCYIL